jgi:hypothetical protein
VSSFERDSQFLAYFAGSPSFVLFVVEAFVCMLPRVWSILLPVFAFVFRAAFGQLAASARLAALFVVYASALAVLLLYLALLLFAPAGILVH